MACKILSFSQSTPVAGSSSLTDSPSAAFTRADDWKTCGVCKRTCVEEASILCEKCNTTYDLKCTGLPPHEIVKYQKKHLYKRKYACQACIEKIHPSEFQKARNLLAERGTQEKEEKEEKEKLKKPTKEKKKTKKK